MTARQAGAGKTTDARILVVGNFLSASSGSRGVCEDLAEHLSASGWTVFTTSDKLGRMARLVDMLKTVWGKRQQYKVATIDTFSGLAFSWAEAVGFALRRLGKPYILTLHGGNLPDFARRQPKRVTRLLNSAAVVTAPSRYLLERMAAYRPDIVLIQNPVDIARYRFALRSAPRPRLVWLRAFHDIYNPSMAVQVAASIIREYPKCRLLMGGGDKGDGSLRETEELAKAQGIAGSVEFSGKMPSRDVPDWLQRGDIFINTTNLDNTPVSVLEAMACGLCVASTNVGGIPYLLEHGLDALLVPPNDPEAMAEAVRRVLTEPGLAESLSRNARRKVEGFDWRVVLPQWEQLFKHVLAHA